jgi:hypothetical protein
MVLKARKSKKSKVAHKKAASKKRAKKVVSKKATKKVVSKKATKKVVSKKATKKAVSKKATKKVVSKKAKKKAVSKKATKKAVSSSGGGFGGYADYDDYAVSDLSVQLEKVSSRVKKKIKTISKVLDSSYSEKEFITFLNNTDVNNIKNLLGMIFTGFIDLKKIVGKDNNEIENFVKDSFGKLSLEEKIIAKNASDKYVNNQELSHMDWCSIFDICEMFDVTKNYKKLKSAVLKKIKRYIEPFDGIIDPIFENIPTGEGFVSGTVLKANPYFFIMLVLFIFITTNGVWELCDCHKKKRT